MGYKYKNMRWKVCRMCGKPFETGRDNRFYCSEKCSYEKKQQTSRAYHEMEAEREAERKAEKLKAKYSGAMSELAELNQKAREAGLSYGKYLVERQFGRV